LFAKKRGEGPSHSETLEAYGSPIPWSKLDMTGIGDLMTLVKSEPVSRVPVDQLRESWPVALLNKAAHDNEPEAFTALLLEFLTTVGVHVPEGVLTVWPKPLGAPPKEETKAIHARWCAMGKPSVYEQALAADFFGKKFSTADPIERKKMIDLARRAVERVEKNRLKARQIKSQKR
jgi:hypothetical protein